MTQTFAQRFLTAVLVICFLPSLAAAQPVQVLHAFDRPIVSPHGALLETPDGSFYGLASFGLYRLAPDGQVTTVARLESGTGALLRGSDGALYGATASDGPDRQGTIFRFDPATSELRTLHAFSGRSGGNLPIGGLVEVGGLLYGVTIGGGPLGRGIVFRVHATTGAFTVLHAFTDEGATPAWLPQGPLALGPDGRLYGATRFGGAEEAGTIYRVDPATALFAVVHPMTAAEGVGPVGPLLLDTDGRFYGAASDGGAGVGTVFSFDPSTGQVQVIQTLDPATDPRFPGPLIKAIDGHLYGVTHLNPDPGVPSRPTLFRLRRTPAVGLDVLRVFDAATIGGGGSEDILLTQGSDGLVYGFAAIDGPLGTGSLYRFDPLAGGPPADPIQFTVIHDFPPGAWSPSRPVLATDGFLYGTTRYGATGRGRVYRLSRADGAVTLLGTLPVGPLESWDTGASALVQAPDGFLYGVTYSAGLTNTENRIVRVDPATGTATTAYTRTDPARRQVHFQGLARTPAGAMYGLRSGETGLVVYRFDAPADTVTDVASMPRESYWRTSELVAFTDGGLYLTILRFVPMEPGPGGRFDILLGRVNLATTSVDVVASQANVMSISNPIEGPGGTAYVGTSTGAMLQMTLATGAIQSVCADPIGPIETLSALSNGSLVGFVSQSLQHRVLCDPTTHAPTSVVQSPGIGAVIEPLTTVAIDGLSYGAAYIGGPHGGGTLFRIAPTAAPPALDSEGDGLPNTWETTYGLDPFSATGNDGAAGDPDRDGRTNAQELADGTHPRGTTRRFFAEGATGAFFATRFDLGNPTLVPVSVLLRFQTDAGATVAHHVDVNPSSHVSIHPASLDGLANATFSTVMEADAAVAVDRTMTWDPSGYGSHLETGVLAPSATWYFAEGSTSSDFALFYLLQNPQPAAVTATVRYLRPGGLSPIERTYTLPPGSRTTIPVDDQQAELASTDVSAVITATLPIVAERAMYLSRPGQPFGAGHESAGVTAPALEWFLAEGATGTFFDLFVLIANPGSTAAAVTIEYLLVGGGSLTKTYTVPANGRSTVWVDDEQLPAGSGQKPLADVAVSMTVRSTNGVPIIVERAMWWPGPAVTANFWYEAHNSPGATTTATRWLAGGGDAGGADTSETYVLIANPTTTPGRARVTLLRDNGNTSIRDYDLPPKSRTNVPVGADFLLNAGVPPGTRTRFAVVVESLGAPPVPIAVERATYASPGGITWASGANALASPLP